MDKILFSILLFISSFLLSQNKKRIDSINAIPFEIKAKNAKDLVDVFLKNAKDAEKLNYTLGEAESYQNLSLVYYYLGKYDYDLKYSFKAISFYQKLNRIEKLAVAYGELGYRMKKRNMKNAQN